MLKEPCSPLKLLVTGLAATSLAAFAATSPAQQPPAATAVAAPAPAEDLSFPVGRSVVESATYTVAATADYASKQKGAKLRFTAVETNDAGKNTHVLTVNTGKHKTVAQLGDTLAGIFRQYLAAAPANQEIGKIGDLNHGGEVRFYAESQESLRYEWEAPGQPAQSTHFKRGDIQAFLGILTHPASAQ